MLNTICEFWGWTGLQPAAIATANEFGNVIVKAADGAYWRICPEALSCEMIARNDADFDAIWADSEFQRDWRMARLVDIASAKLGPVDANRCYCLKIPAVLGGAHDESNFGTNSRRELLAFSGTIAEQIENLPDGATVELRVKHGSVCRVGPDGERLASIKSHSPTTARE